MRRVVITGLGIVSCLGNNQEEVHQLLLNSNSLIIILTINYNFNIWINSIITILYFTAHVDRRGNGIIDQTH